eukprot:Em0005g1207a
MISDTLSESGSEEAVLLITVKKRGKKLLAKVPLTGRAQVEVIECQLDTAASCNAMSVQDYEKLGKPKFGNSRATLSMYDGTARKSLGVVRVDLRSLEKSGMIAREEEPTEWISNLTAVWKADKTQVRVCLDPQELNKAVLRNHFKIPTLDDVLPELTGAKVFIILDAKDGFLQIRLNEHNSKLTTFWGARGVSEEITWHSGAREQNLTFNKDKMRLHLSELIYIGHQVSPRSTARSRQSVSSEEHGSAYLCIRSVVIQCDAGGEGLGATLLQDGRPVASASLSLTSIHLRKENSRGDRPQVIGNHCEEVLALSTKALTVNVATIAKVASWKGEAEELGNDEVFQVGRESMRAEVVAKELNVIEQRDFFRISDQRMEKVKKAAGCDDEQRMLAQVIGQGWPTTIREVSALVRPYWNFRDTMVVQDGIVYKGSQLVVPKSLRSDYLKRLHSSHLGSESTLRRARDAVYWPHMSEDIKRITSECKQCEEDGAAQSKEPQLAHSIPKYPWIVQAQFGPIYGSSGMAEYPNCGDLTPPHVNDCLLDEPEGGSGERMETGSSPSTKDVGDPVQVQDLRAKKTEWMRGYCRGQLSDRSYMVEVNGQLLHRNRQFLKASKNHPLELELEAEWDNQPSESSELGVIPDQGSPPKSAGAMDQMQSTRSPSPEVIVYPPEVVNRQIQHKLKSASQAGSELEPLDSPTVTTTRRGRVVRRPSRYQDSAI